ncbi:MAG: DUF6465 family protein [Defluviitaleaceae bacterium]|nr:DUF6465 family protein [Defluviitaleaceae bacterium]
MQVSCIIEVSGRQVDTAAFLDNIKESWKADGKLIKDLKSVNFYYNTDEGNVYYVINGDITGSFQA